MQKLSRFSLWNGMPQKGFTLTVLVTLLLLLVATPFIKQQHVVAPSAQTLQSLPVFGIGLSAHPDNSSNMNAYFANFTLLMKRLGPGNYDAIQGFGKTTIVHIEPDFEGYAQQAVRDNTKCYGHCTGQGNNPANLNAAVASSGIT